MRYKISVQHTSDHELDGKWHLLSETDDAAFAIYEYLKFQESYGRPVRILDTKFRRRKGNNHDEI